MNLKELEKEYDILQKKYGEKSLDSIYYGGQTKSPNLCFVFMNPTKRVIASSKSWKGLKSPWIGTKNIWDLFYKLDLLDEKIYEQIRSISGSEWTTSFALNVYKDVIKHHYFITNLAKCTQIDARALPDFVYLEYLDLFFKEIQIVNPEIIILFGNQVSSIVLEQKICVSQVRRKCFIKEINGKTYKFYSVYYPVGNGRFHMNDAIEDIRWIINYEFLNRKI